MANILLASIIAAVAALSPEPRPFVPGATLVEDPVQALHGYWIEEGGKETCPLDATRVEVASDRKSFVVHESDGESHDATEGLVLQAHPNFVYIFYKGEKRRTANGDPLVWAVVFEGPNRYKMRRTDWPSDHLTIGTWRRCE
jgi:hypothetical protein